MVNGILFWIVKLLPSFPPGEHKFYQENIIKLAIKTRRTLKSSLGGH